MARKRLGKREREALKLKQAGRKPRNFSKQEVSIPSCLARMFPTVKTSKQWGYDGNTAKRIHHIRNR